MRPSDHLAFADTAQLLGVWILVRETNAKSCAYIDSLDYIGKPFDVKAKTADDDAGPYKIGGLVADPTNPRLQAGFSPGKLPKAIALWRDLLKERPALARGGPSGPYAVIADAAHKHYGCLTRDGKPIHGDFDLYDIVDPRRPTGNLGLVRESPHAPGSTKTTHDTIPHHWTAVSRMINTRLRKTMIYHGGDAQWISADKTPGHADDNVEAFGPAREHVLLRGTRSIAAFYGNRFPNRRTLRQSH